MKRDNRLVLVTGVFLAIVSFVLVAILLTSPRSPVTTQTVTDAQGRLCTIVMQDGVVKAMDCD